MNNWIIDETQFQPDLLHSRETLFTIGNGYLGTRGAFEEGYPGQTAATLVHGLFDDAPVVYTELVNVPNWLNFILLLDGERFRMDRGTVLDYRRELNLKTATLTRTVRWRSPAGRTVVLKIQRFASLAEPHLMAIHYQITSVDFSGPIEFRAGLDGHVANEALLHLEVLDQGPIGEQGAYLTVQTAATHLPLCMAGALELPGTPAYTYRDCDGAPGIAATLNLLPGQTATAIKYVAIYSGRESPDVTRDARNALLSAVTQGYAALARSHSEAWAAEWNDCNITIEGDDRADRALRYSLFQLLAAAPRHDERVNIGAKLLSGFGYRGHAFWDTEIFMLPFFIYTRPAIARNLLMYRYHTLPGARRKAQLAGYEGAMYAWESAATGDETTPRWVPGPQGEELVRIWCGDIEQHISADVAYGVMQYWHATGDHAWMRDYGAEIVLETARFWRSRAEWDPERGCYELHDVIGPDEYHEHVNNNAYTNRMAVWNLEAGLEVLHWLQADFPDRAAALIEQLKLIPTDLEQWEHIIQHMLILQDSQSGRIEQFEGFYQLIDQDLESYEPRTQSMQALLGIAGANRQQVLKQPDVVMLLYLLGDRYPPAILRTNWEYYTPRTDLSYGSSLGPPIQALVTARLGKVEAAYEHFIHAAATDLEDVRGNSADGLHGATAGGLWQAVVFGFGGVQFNHAGYTLTPALPAGWKRLSFSLYYQGQKITVEALAHPTVLEKISALPD